MSRLRALLPWLLATVVPMLAQAASADNQQVADGVKALEDYQLARAIAAFTPSYIAALHKGDRQSAARYLLLIGTAFRFDENLESAVACCRQAQQLDPLSIRARVMTADALVRIGRMEEAEQQLHRLSTVAEKDWLVARSFGNFYAAEGDVEQAYKYLKTAERLDPQDARTHWLLARLNHDDDAGKQFALASQCVGSAYLKNMYAWQSEQKLNPGSPRRAPLEEAARLLPKEPSWRVSMAWLHLKDGEEGKAFQLMQQAVQMPRFYWRAFSQLALYGVFHNHRPVADQAMDYFQQLEPQYPELYYVKGQIAASGNHLRQAEECFRQALALNPRMNSAYVALSLLPDYAAFKKSVDGTREHRQDALAAAWLEQLPFAPEPYIYQADLQRHRMQWQPAADNYAKARRLLTYCTNFKGARLGQWLPLASGGAAAFYKIGDEQTAYDYAAIFNQLKPVDDSLIRVRPATVDLSKLKDKARAAAQHGLLADALYETGNLDDCIAQYNIAVSIADHIDWHRGLLKAYMDKRDVAAATKEDFIVANHAVIHDVPEAVSRARQLLPKGK